MKTDTLKLLKHFANVFRNLANGNSLSSVNPLVLRYLSRKDLIEVITSSSFTSSKDVKEIDLLKMENEELLQAIGSELHIIAYLTGKWCEEGLPTDVPETPKKKSASKPNNDGTKK